MAPRGIGHRVEGTHAVAAAMRAGRGIRLTVERQRLRAGVVAELVEEARSVGTDIVLVDSVRELAETESPQGLILEAAPIPVHTVDELAVPAAAILVLDHIEDPHNVGAAARSARAAGMSGLVVAERRSAPLSAAAFKAAAGALEALPVAVVSSIADAVARLRARSVWTVGLAADAPDQLFGLALLTEPVALCVGAEGTGLSRLVRERLDLVVSIPMAPHAESLNASVTAALAAFEVARVRASGSAAGAQ